MLLEAIFSKLFIFRAFSTIVGIGKDTDATARGEETRHFDVFWIHQLDEVLHDNVHAIFVEVAVISEAEKIELEALALHHAYIRNVADANFCKIRLSRDRAETGELWAVKAYPVIVVGVFVDKRF